MSELSVSEVLNRAADLIEPEGAWTQGAFSRNADGVANAGNGTWASAPVCYCAVGAVAVALGLSVPTEAYMTGATATLEASLGVPWSLCVTLWNDAPGRTQAEVVATLRAAAKQAEAA